MNDDEHFMRRALEVASEKGTDPSLSPIGCVIVQSGQVLAARRNQVAEHHDSTAHAEIEAIRDCGDICTSSDPASRILSESDRTYGARMSSITRLSGTARGSISASETP
jgi:tRNA(Arg) A34 adenosine deaminase TadA